MTRFVRAITEVEPMARGGGQGRLNGDDGERRRTEDAQSRSGGGAEGNAVTDPKAMDDETSDEGGGIAQV